MKKITETQRLSTTAVRAMCIERDLYTHGTNEEYAAMFDMVRAIPGPIITAEDLHPIAADIVAHSGPGVEVEGVMWELGRRIERFYEVEEPDQYVVTCECTDDGPEFMLYCDGKKHREYEEIVGSFKTHGEAAACLRRLSAPPVLL